MNPRDASAEAPGRDAITRREPVGPDRDEGAAARTPLVPEPPAPAATPAAPPSEVRAPSEPPERRTVPPTPTGGSMWVTASPSRVRAKLARFGGPRHQSNPALEPILRVAKQSHPKEDTSIIERAYAVAERAHAGQTRRSGDPYITHPLAVALILAELGLPPPTLAAALLHDTVEDTPYTLDQLAAEFGPEIAAMVDAVTKLDKVEYGEAAQAETVRKMIVAMSKDIQVLFIKLADRLHNARTYKCLPEGKANRSAKETLEIYAPLAHRLGMNTIKWELEDLAFAALNPRVHKEIVTLVAERAPARDEHLRHVIDEVNAVLLEARISGEVSGRPKHYFSIYQKMIVRGRHFDEIYDLIAVRVLVDSLRDCYAVLGSMHTRWTPMQGRFKDYIATPKFNMYQSLHTTVMGPGGKPVEIQIRTRDMHQRAEYGVAAHWKYKQGPADGTTDLAWVRQLLDWQKDTTDPGEFLESLRYEINATEVYVFTPKGTIVNLPAGSTPVDFAYAVHTEVGHHCMGARVNGQLAPLERPLSSGDMVEILTSKADGAGPSRDWLSFVQSPRARSKIRQWFSKERREEAIESGKDSIATAMRKQQRPVRRLMTAETLTALATQLRYADIDALYAAVGEGHVSAQSLVDKVIAAHGGEDGASEDLAEATIPGSRRRLKGPVDPGVVVVGTTDVWVKLARCCTPVPGDPILGFVTRGQGVSVHRTDCPNAERLQEQPERLTEVEWSPTASSVFLVAIQAEALDRPRLLSDVTSVLADHHANIRSAEVQTLQDRVARLRFVFEMGEPTHLGHVISAVKQVGGVFDVYRVNDGKATKMTG